MNRPYVKRIEKPWGYELHWVGNKMPYMGKIIHIKRGRRLSLQLHDKKQESWLLIKGKAKILWDDKNGKLVEAKMKFGRGYTCQINQRHRLCAITDCDIIEVSTPEIGTTYRLEDDYQRGNETEKLREQKNRGWSG